MSDTGKQNYFLRFINSLSNLQKLVTGLSTVFVGVWGLVNSNIPVYIIVIVLVFVIGSLVFAEIFKRKKKIQPISDGRLGGKPKSMARNLMSFEEGDELLGRESEIKAIFTIIDSNGFRFGYVSGEAGVGKTSLLQAGLIPTIKKYSSYYVVFIPKLRSSPTQEISDSILKPLDITSGNKNLDAYFTEISRKGFKKILLIIDQFEDFFLIYQSLGERKPLAQELKKCFSSSEYQLSALLCLRKEFVDDLNDFAPEIENPTNSLYRVKIDNWSEPEALSVLRQISQMDGLPFSEELVSMVIHDLSSHGFVRPVEIQIVVAQLKTQKIFDLPTYKKRGRAYKILADFVSSVIEPEGEELLEAEIITAKHTLLILSGEYSDSRRTKGLDFDELLILVKKQIGINTQKDFFAQVQVKELLQKVIDRFWEHRLIILEDEHRYNLAHDYIVQPIRDATKGIETAEEQANRMLKYFLSAHGQRLSRRNYRFINRFASKAALSEISARERLRIARNRILITQLSFVGILIAIIIGSVLFTKEQRYSVSQIATSDTPIHVAEKYNLAVLHRNDSIYVYDLGSDNIELPIQHFYQPHSKPIYSQDGDFVLFRSTKSSDYLIFRISGSGLTPIEVVSDRGVDMQSINEDLLVGTKRDSIFIYHLDSKLVSGYSIQTFLKKRYWISQLGSFEDLPVSSKYVESNTPYYTFSTNLENDRSLVFRIVKNTPDEEATNIQTVGKIRVSLPELFANYELNSYADSLHYAAILANKDLYVKGKRNNNKTNNYVYRTGELSARFIPTERIVFTGSSNIKLKMEFLIHKNFSRPGPKSGNLYHRQLEVVIDTNDYFSFYTAQTDLSGLCDVYISKSNKLVLTAINASTQKVIEVYNIGEESTQKIIVKNIKLPYSDSSNYNFQIESELKPNIFLVTTYNRKSSRNTESVAYLIDVRNFDSLKYYQLKPAAADRYYNFFLISPDNKSVLSFSGSSGVNITSLDSVATTLSDFAILGGQFAIRECFWNKESNYLYVLYDKEIAGGFFGREKLTSFNIYENISDQIQNIAVPKSQKFLWVITNKNLSKVRRRTFFWKYLPVIVHPFESIDRTTSREKLYRPDYFNF